MKKTYYNPEDLKKFGNVGDIQKELVDKFFDYYNTLPTVLSWQKNDCTCRFSRCSVPIV